MAVAADRLVRAWSFHTLFSPIRHQHQGIITFFLLLAVAATEPSLRSELKMLDRKWQFQSVVPGMLHEIHLACSERVGDGRWSP